MSLPKAFVLAFFLNLLVPYTLAKYGEYCETPVGDQGNCVPIKSCAGALEMLKSISTYGPEKFENEIRFLQKSMCESSDGKPLVCCPKENIQTNPYVYGHLKKLSCGNSFSNKVSKGEPADLFEYRWMALLKYKGKEPFACGGSLIDERHVLTAAHCLNNFKNLPIAVRLGEYNLKNETDCAHYGKRKKCLDPVQDIGIEKYIIHEDYVYKGLHNDIAILRLNRQVNLKTKSVQAICLPLGEELQTYIPDDFLVAGWGLTEYGNRSNVLLWTSIPKRPYDFCESTLGLILNEGHICAGGRHFFDTCKGDSGGPIFFPNPYVDGVVRTIQYGIVSLGADRCGRMSVPTVFTNVSYYMQWITDHMTIDGDDDYTELGTETPQLLIENSAHNHSLSSYTFFLTILSLFRQFSKTS